MYIYKKENASSEIERKGYSKQSRENLLICLFVEIWLKRFLIMLLDRQVYT